ncbi:MAG: carbamoyl-phosphate synthase large subunit, partial [Pseudomonadota bacterium]
NACLHWAFENIKPLKVVCAADTRNNASIKIIKNLGMSYKKQMIFRGLNTDYFEITSEEYLSLQKSKILLWKKDGFSDSRIAKLANVKEKDLFALRQKLGITPVFKRVDTCAAEFDSDTPYMYSTFEVDSYVLTVDSNSQSTINNQQSTSKNCESNPTNRTKVIILGGGPNRIGQGIEFDYCCVHASYALKEAGYETIMINCNPETVSTDYDTSDRLYFEPLTAENVIAIVRKEQENGKLLGVIVQFGGQTPLKLAKQLEEAGIPIIGTSPDSIDLAEDRERFQQLLHKLALKQPANYICHSAIEVVEQANKIGYPVVVRPSYVLGGRAMAIIHDFETLQKYSQEIIKSFGDGPILIDSYLQNAIEVDVDAISDGKNVYVAGIMEHIEEAGIHSGDSACSLPAYSLQPEILEEIKRQTVELAIALNVIGLMNIQFAVKDNIIYILEVNPRASRTVPFVAKATGLQLAKIAAKIMANEGSRNLVLGASRETLIPNTQNLEPLKHIAVKEAVFPFARFAGVDVILGPEMKSTGEAMGIDTDFARAFAKAQIAAGTTLPLKGKVFVSVKEGDKAFMVKPVANLLEMGFEILATEGTKNFLTKHGLNITQVNKVHEGSPHIVDMMKNGEIALVINTTEGAKSIADSYSIRRTALLGKIPYYTTLAGSRSAVAAIKAISETGLGVRSLQDYFGG